MDRHTQGVCNHYSFIAHCYSLLIIECLLSQSYVLTHDSLFVHLLLCAGIS